MFTIVSMYAYLKARTAERWAKAVGFGTACGLCALCAFATKENSALQLTLALSYGSRNEICQAMQSIAVDIEQRRIRAADIDEKMISQHLFTRQTPDPDLLIRTSGEMRISNFLLWQIAYSEIYVTDTLWPDFTREEFLQSI